MESVDELAEMMKALSDPTRLRLLQLLAQPEAAAEQQETCCGGRQFLCVNACADTLGVSQSAISAETSPASSSRCCRQRSTAEIAGCRAAQSLA